MTLSDGFVPEAGDTFPILKGLGGIQGMLALGAMPALPNRLVWDLDVTSNQVLLNVVPAPSGDFNLDGVVDSGDYISWRRSVGQTGAGLAADGNGDGQVDGADLRDVERQFRRHDGQRQRRRSVGCGRSWYRNRRHSVLA